MNMRKLIAMLSAMLMLCAIIPMGAISVSAADAVYSADFEDGTLGTWTTSSSSYATIQTVAAADLPVANPNGGEYAMMHDTSTKYPYLVDTTSVTVEANTDYIVSVDVLHGSKNWPVQVIMGTNSWLGSYVFNSGATNISYTAWTTLTYIFNTGSNTTLYMGIKSAYSNSVIYVDNFTLTPVDAATYGKTDGHIYNGNFETGALDPWNQGSNVSAVEDPTESGQGYVMQANENTSGAVMIGQIANNLKTNTDYVLSFKMYSYSELTTGAFWVQFDSSITDWTVNLGDSGMSSQSYKAYIPRINVTTHTGAWYDLSIRFNSGDLTSTGITFLNYRANAGQYYFDDIRVAEVTYDGYIYDGSFETASTTYWDVPAGEYVEDEVYKGDIALKGTSTTKYGKFATQTVTVAENTEYAISFKAKLESADTAGQCRVYVKGGSTGSTLNGTYYWTTSTDSWKTITVTFNSGANTTADIQLQQGVGGGGGVYYDDLVMWQVKDPSFDGWLYNGDFETGTSTSWNVSQSTVIDTDAAHEGTFGAHLIGNSAGWGGVLNQTISGLESGATYNISFWYTAVQQGINFKMTGVNTETSYHYSYLKYKTPTQVSGDFVADDTSAKLNFSCSGIGTSSSSYEAGVDEVYVDSIVISLVKCAECSDFDSCEDDTCNTCGTTREAGTCVYTYECSKACSVCGADNPAPADCVSDSEYECTDGTCTVCGEIVAGTGHSYFYSCDAYCQICYEYTNEEAAHSIVHVEAVEATCTTNGNIEYWYCEYCGSCWDNENGTGMPLNRMMVTIWASHTYDDDLDVSCNECGEVRLVEYAVVSFGGNSASEDVSGLAFRFDVAVDGVAVDGTAAIYDNATVVPTSESGALKLVGMGAVVSNNWGITYLDYVDGAHIIDVPAVYLCDLEADSAAYAVRIINIPESAYDTYITARPYYIYENAEGEQVVVYDYEQMATYNGVIGG